MKMIADPFYGVSRRAPGVPQNGLRIGERFQAGLQGSSANMTQQLFSLSAHRTLQ
jgi:hypothetical protein